MINLLDDHRASYEAYKFLLSTETVQYDRELVEALLRGMQRSMEALTNYGNK